MIVVTDGLAPFWSGATAGRLLRTFGEHCPVAIVNPFPQTFWHRTNLASQQVQLHSPRPAAAGVALRYVIPPERRDPFLPLPDPACLAVPVLELSPRWLTWWAAFVMEPSPEWRDATVHLCDYAIEGPDAADQIAGDRSASPREIVRRFRTSCSPAAYRLATYLAAVPLTLATMELVQNEMLPHSRPVDLAELYVSELIQELEPGARTASRTHEFLPGVREALLASATRDESAHVVSVVAQHYGDSAPGVLAMLRVLEQPDDAPEGPVTNETLPLVRIELAVLRALSGPYVARAQRLALAIAEVEQHQPVVGAGATGTRLPAGCAGGHEHHTKAGEHAMNNPSDRIGATNGSTSNPTAGINLLNTPRVRGRLPARNGLFTGRSELLDRLDQQLRSQRVTAVLPEALHGKGGVGKSQIAIEYAYRHHLEYELIWWVPAEHPAQILTALGELADYLDLQVGEETISKVPAVQEALRTGVPVANWLIIFDNAERLEAVMPYLPSGGSGKVLLTSRNPEWTDAARTLEVDVFARVESIELLRKRDPNITDEEADQLAAALEDLPLAIEQAGAWRATTGMPVVEYVRLLNEKRAELLALHPSAGYEMPVAAAWNVALDRLGVENPAALQLLQVCSFFAPEPIARELFTGPRLVPIAPELDIALRDPAKRNRAIRDIQRYALARIDYREDTLQMHRLVREVLVGRMPTEQRSEMEHGAHTLLAGGNPGEPGNGAQWRRFQALLPHVTASNAVECDDPWARQLVLDVVKFLYYWGDWKQCRDLAQQIVGRWRQRLGPDDPQALEAAKWFAYVRRLLGEYREAAALNEEILRRYEAAVGPDDEGRLDAMTMVAGDYHAAGQYARSRVLCREVLQRKRQTFGPDDPATLEAAHSLGVTLRLTGEFEAARQLDLDTYERRVTVLGADHHLTLLTLSGLTIDQREAGAYAEALARQEQLYERRHSTVGINHPSTLESALNLAVAWRRAGLAERARKLSEDTMARYAQRFGPHHPYTIAAAFNVAIDLRDAGDLARARTLATEVVERYGNALGHRHPFTLAARTNLAAILRLSDDPEGALHEDRIALDGLRTQVGDDHVLTLASTLSLASDHFAMGDPATASTLDEQAYQAFSRVLGAGHPSTLAAAVNWALDLRALGRTAEAERLHADALAGYQQALGQEHPAWQAAAEWQRAICDVDPMPF